MPFEAHQSHYRERCAFLFPPFNHPVNSTYHLSNPSTQHPKYQNQPHNSLPFSTVDQFPLTRKIKNPGSETYPLTSPDSRKSLVFYTFSIFYSLTFDINTTVSTWHERTESTSFACRFVRLDPPLFLPSQPYVGTYPLL